MPTSPPPTSSRGGVTRDDDDHPAVLRGHQHLPVAEPLDDRAFQHDRRTVGRAVAVPQGDQRDAVRLAQVDAERLGPLHQPGDVGVAAQQVVDELGALRLLVADHVPPLGLVAVDQHADGVVEHPQHRFGGAADLLRIGRADHDRQLAPQPPRGGQVQIHRLAGADPLRGRASPEFTDGVELPGVGAPAVDRRVGQQRQVLAEQVRRRRGRPPPPTSRPRPASRPTPTARDRPRRSPC